MSEDALDRFRDPRYERLLRSARRSLQTNDGSLDGYVGVSNPTDAEREAVIGITGRFPRHGTKSARVHLRELDAVVRDNTGLGITGLLETLGPKLRYGPRIEAQKRKARQEALTAAEGSPLHGSAAWYRTWLADLTRDGTLGTMVGQGTALWTLTRAARVLEAVEGRPDGAPPLLLPALAVDVTGDTKALNHGTTLSRLVLRALALRTGTERPDGSEERRSLWESCDVVLDDLASRVLVLNLSAHGEGLGEWLTGAARHGTPFHVTLHQLVHLPITVEAPVVYVCENPAVLRRAAGELGADSAPLLCTEGYPSAAFHRLASAIVDGGGELRYHGDFDWPGTVIAHQVVERHAARPWRMSARDYRAHVREESHPLKGDARPTPWDPGLAEAMREHGRAVYEETVADILLADLLPDTAG
ncbi:TIGR02679 family protein [Nocardiopsis alborubida]|uniref:TIGR02679 family protein n=1 Tax=Nocardiopsis alborubida TaxID=146802 RepID=A0A7X6RRY6_9ACTN|nr:TIGR02679 family protein [Nocardiopsis alborubida]NKZ00375.1 TIGR02679 family protein [Nocardiopsis alborubida]